MTANVPSLLFLCMGNICRSPTVEAIARTEFERSGVVVDVASAGTHDYHIGHRADSRSVDAAKAQGYELDAHRARQLEPADFDRYDAILAMDEINMFTAERIRPQGSRAELALFLPYAGIDWPVEVPDPYYGENNGFDEVVALARRGVSGLIARLERDRE